MPRGDDANTECGWSSQIASLFMAPRGSEVSEKLPEVGASSPKSADDSEKLFVNFLCSLHLQTSSNSNRIRFRLRPSPRLSCCPPPAPLTCSLLLLFLTCTVPHSNSISFHCNTMERVESEKSSLHKHDFASRWSPGITTSSSSSGFSPRPANPNSPLAVFVFRPARAPV